MNCFTTRSLLRVLRAFVVILALAACGCRAVITRDVIAVSLLTSPTISHGKYRVRTADGQYRLLDLGGYGSKSEVTGADLAALAAAVMKVLLLP